MRRSLTIISLLATLALIEPADTLAQRIPQRGGVYWEILRLRSQVNAQNARITALEQQMETLGLEVGGLQSQVTGMSSRLDFVWDAVRTYYSAEVDCDAGESVQAAIGAAHPTIPKVVIGIKGTCHEHLNIDRDGVSLYGLTADAAIEAPSGVPVAVFVTAEDIRLDNLTIQAAADSPDSEALRVLRGQLAGANIRLRGGGVTATRNATLELFSPVIEGSGRYGVLAREDSYAFLSNCQIRDSAEAAVEVDASVVTLNSCVIEDSSKVGIRARHARLGLWAVEVVDAMETGLEVGNGSSVDLGGGIGMGSRITGSAVGLTLSGGSTLLLGESTIENNADGVVLFDASVLKPDWPYSMRVTGNTSAGVRCEPSPAVPQIGGLGAGQVFGNGVDFVDCPMP